MADVPNIVDVTEDQFVLVNLSGKGLATGAYDVVKVSDVQILSDSTITKFTKASATKIASKLTVDGEEYSASQKAFYDKDVLDVYDQQLLTDMSYNVYLDQYGYAIGVDLFEGTLNYVFITGYDRGTSHISIKTATAGAIFLDGTMKEITVNVTDTNKNIDRMNNNTNDNGASGDYYFKQWSGDGKVSENRWYTYTVTESGVYTLKPALRSLSTAVTEDTTIDCTNVRLEGTGAIEKSDVYENSTNVRAYGEDESIFITVEQDKVDTTTGSPAIADVTGVYTGVQDVELVIDESEVIPNDGQSEKWAVHTVYDKDNYIIASIVVGEAQGSVANYAYVLSDEAESEEKIGDTYYWEFEAILDGEFQTLTAKSKYTEIIDTIDTFQADEPAPVAPAERYDDPAVP